MWPPVAPPPNPPLFRATNELPLPAFLLPPLLPIAACLVRNDPPAGRPDPMSPIAEDVAGRSTRPGRVTKTATLNATRSDSIRLVMTCPPLFEIGTTSSHRAELVGIIGGAKHSAQFFRYCHAIEEPPPRPPCRIRADHGSGLRSPTSKRSSR